MAEDPRDARLRHQRVRQHVHDGVARRRRASSTPAAPAALYLGPIDGPALRDYRNAWGGPVRFDWDAIVKAYRKRYARFETAIWSDGLLCGLAMGRVSTARTAVSVNFVEGAPYAHRLRGEILAVTVDVAVALGGDPALTYAATAPLPDGIDEWMFAGFLRKRAVATTPCHTIDLEVPA